jgi:uncharacterized lipoprotein YmbA
MIPTIKAISANVVLRPAIDRARRFLALGLLFSLAMLFTGCLSRPALSKEHFLISLPTPERAGQPRMDETLSLGIVTVAPQFEGRSLVYRMSDQAYEFDPYAEFVIPPDRMIGGAARAWLRETGLFGEIIEPDSYAHPTRLAELHVTEIYGDFRKADDAAAVFTMRFVLLGKAAPNVDQPGVALAKVYSRRLRLRERTAAAVVHGLQEAFAQAMADLRADLGKL